MWDRWRRPSEKTKAFSNCIIWSLTMRSISSLFHHNVIQMLKDSFRVHLFHFKRLTWSGPALASVCGNSALNTPNCWGLVVNKLQDNGIDTSSIGCWKGLWKGLNKPSETECLAKTGPYLASMSSTTVLRTSASSSTEKGKRGISARAKPT